MGSCTCMILTVICIFSALFNIRYRKKTRHRLTKNTIRYYCYTVIVIYVLFSIFWLHRFRFLQNPNHLISFRSFSWILNPFILVTIRKVFIFLCMSYGFRMVTTLEVPWSNLANWLRCRNLASSAHDK